MKNFAGTVDGIIVAKYRKGKVTWTCKICDSFYCATFHNGVKTARTYYSTDRNEINELIKRAIVNGFRKEKQR